MNTTGHAKGGRVPHYRISEPELAGSMSAREPSPQQCFIGRLDPGQVRHCKRTINVTQEGLNKAFGRAQGSNANVSATGVVNASNPTYFNVVVP